VLAGTQRGLGLGDVQEVGGADDDGLDTWCVEQGGVVGAVPGRAVASGDLGGQLGAAVLDGRQAQREEGRQLLDQGFAEPADAGEAEAEAFQGSTTPLT
jgi:hypothetical protein